MGFQRAYHLAPYNGSMYYFHRCCWSCLPITHFHLIVSSSSHSNFPSRPLTSKFVCIAKCVCLLKWELGGLCLCPVIGTWDCSILAAVRDRFQLFTLRRINTRWLACLLAYPEVLEDNKMCWCRTKFWLIHLPWFAENVRLRVHLSRLRLFSGEKRTRHVCDVPAFFPFRDVNL